MKDALKNFPALITILTKWRNRSLDLQKSERSHGSRYDPLTEQGEDATEVIYLSRKDQRSIRNHPATFSELAAMYSEQITSQFSDIAELDPSLDFGGRSPQFHPSSETPYDSDAVDVPSGRQAEEMQISDGDDVEHDDMR